MDRRKKRISEGIFNKEGEEEGGGKVDSIK
jgi:hypothetical protein